MGCCAHYDLKNNSCSFSGEECRFNCNANRCKLLDDMIFSSRDLKEIIDKEEQMKNKSFITEKCGTNTPPDNIPVAPPKLENLVFAGKVYKGGKAISQQEYDRLRAEDKIEKDIYYLIKPKTSVNTKLDATKKWCSISNAIIKKYKNMVEFDDEDVAIRQLNAIRILLVGHHLFLDSDFEDWGEE